jgi:hypothetical protein
MRSLSMPKQRGCVAGSFRPPGWRAGPVGARLADLLIASTAAANGLPLYTRNPDDFSPLAKLVGPALFKSEEIVRSYATTVPKSPLRMHEHAIARGVGAMDDMS